MRRFYIAFFLLLSACISNSEELEGNDSEQQDSDQLEEVVFLREPPKDSLPVIVESREDHYPNSEAVFSAKKYRNNVLLTIDLDLVDTLVLPEIKNYTFGEEKLFEVHALGSVARLLNEEGKELAEINGEGYFDDEFKRGSSTIDILPQHFASLSVGEHHLQLELETYFTEFFGAKSKIRPVTARLSFDFTVDSIYQSTVYFKKLVLNKEYTKEKLAGGNDMQNPDPEACIRISWLEERLIYDYSKNSFRLNSNERTTFYHNALSDTLRIAVLDMDYGFNASDLLADTLLTVESLLDKKGENISLQGTDELRIYSKTKGVVNAK